MTGAQRSIVGRVVVVIAVVAACGDEADPAQRAGELEVWADPPGAQFAEAIVVILEASRPATIQYTLDGRLPTVDSPVYTGPIRLTESTLLHAVALDDAGRRSDLVDAFFTRLPDPEPWIELPPRSLRVTPQQLVFTPSTAEEDSFDFIELEAIGTEAVRVYSVNYGPAGTTTSGYDPEAFTILPESSDPLVRPGENVRIRVDYEATRTARMMILNIDTDADNTDTGRFSVVLMGRMFL